MNINRVAIIGTGMMGPGIAAITALADLETTLISRRPDCAKDGVCKAIAHMEQLLENGLTDARAVESAKKKLHGTADLESAVRDVHLVIEAISENLDLKQQMLQRLDRLTPASTIIATNTSGLSVTAICALAEHKERTATTHFWAPPHLIPLVEVVMGDCTSEETARTLMAFLRHCGKKPVLVRKDLPGQLANRIFQAMIREAANMVQEGIATAEDVDTAVKNGLGMRLPVWGILEHMDAVGVDLGFAVQESVLPALNNEPRAPRIFRDLVSQGNLGAKTGTGFYDWTVRDMDALRRLRDDFIIHALRFKAEHA